MPRLSQPVQLNKLNLSRIVIEHVTPSVDEGLYPAKRCLNDLLTISANIFADGHDEIDSNLWIKHESDENWVVEKLIAIGNDSWEKALYLNKLGKYFFKIIAWIDEFKTWQEKFKKKVSVNQDIKIEIASGLEFVKYAVKKNRDSTFKTQLKTLLNEKDEESLITQLSSSSLLDMMQVSLVPKLKTESKEFQIIIDRKRAGFSAWYELFPRSLGKNSHGTLKDLIAELSNIKNMGFDIVYLPPIHPIGHTARKGKNNNIKASQNEPGSPWAIGNSDGGHREIHSELGTFDDFNQLIKTAKKLELEIALDLALQCSPDHPYLKEHPAWFKKRSDGSLHYAENPPKKYQDIYPLNFDSKEWESLWEEIKNVVLFWIDKGVKIFRVDNPHTKPFKFWEWLINEIKTLHPEIIFLAEAFTRPRIMEHLAKIGFSQSYTYFTWRHNKYELTEYLIELTKSPMREYFRPNFWPNTPDILPKHLQNQSEIAFKIRFILAATLSTNYGIYGPAYELAINKLLNPNSEEYLDSEKYEIKKWDLKLAANFRKWISEINQIRNQHEALQNMWSLNFHPTDNEDVIAYSKHNHNHSDVILTLVNLNAETESTGFVYLDLEKMNIKTEFIVIDLLNHETYQWSGSKNYFALNPKKFIAHIFHVKHEILP